MLATVLPGGLGYNAMKMSSHAGDDAAGRLGRVAMYLLSHAGNNSVESC
jgi:hypothetical protein